MLARSPASRLSCSARACSPLSATYAPLDMIVPLPGPEGLGRQLPGQAQTKPHFTFGDAFVGGNFRDAAALAGGGRHPARARPPCRLGLRRGQPFELAG